MGNRLTKSEAAGVTNYQFNVANEQTLLTPPVGSTTISTYDANGNLTLENLGGALTTYTWDSENRLTRVDNSDGTNEQYTFSADGLRQKKVNCGGTVLFVWDSQNVLIETDGSLVTQVEYTDLPGIWSGKYSLRRSGQSSFYVPDCQGTTRQLADSTQAATDTLLTDAWGREITSTWYDRESLQGVRAVGILPRRREQAVCRAKGAQKRAWQVVESGSCILRCELI